MQGCLKLTITPSHGKWGGGPKLSRILLKTGEINQISGRGEIKDLTSLYIPDVMWKQENWNDCRPEYGFHLYNRGAILGLLTISEDSWRISWRPEMALSRCSRSNTWSSFCTPSTDTKHCVSDKQNNQMRPTSKLPKPGDQIESRDDLSLRRIFFWCRAARFPQHNAGSNL